MGRNLINLKIFFSLILFFNLSFCFASENLTLELISNKDVYQVGENINFTLKVSNYFDESVNGKIQGSAIIGDVGYEIQCFEYEAASSDGLYLGLNPLVASFSNSNVKSLTSLFVCDGSQMQSSRAVSSNSGSSISNSQESFEIGPFTFKYSLNGVENVAKSNVLNITVVESMQDYQNQQNSQQSSNNQNSQQNSNQQSNQQNSQNQNSDQSESLEQNINPQTNSALSNNQQNSQSVDELKKQISNEKDLDELRNEFKEEEVNSGIYFLILIVLILIGILIYFKYFKNQEITDKDLEEVIEIPEYIQILNLLTSDVSDKEKAVILSKSVRIYIGSLNNLKEDLTHEQAKKFTKDKFLLDILEKTEGIEFAGKTEKLDHRDLVIKLRRLYKNG